MGRNEHGDESVDVDVNGLYQLTWAAEQIAFELKMLRTIAQQFITKREVLGHIKAEAEKFYNG